jgi:hypothetical protein
VRANALDDIIARLEGLPADEQAEVVQAAQDETQGMLWVPNTGPQTQAYFCPADELLYGGEAGGGKSDFLIGLAINEHDVSQIFRLQHNDRVAIVRRLAEILAGGELAEGSKPPGYNGSEHIWTAQQRMGVRKRFPVIEFGALSEPGAWKHYQGRPASLKAWDELTHFAREGFETVNAWLRSVDPLQRCRIVAASNPPTSVDGLWVVDYFAPWVDDRHANPAKPGELRYFTSIKGEQVEVDASWRGRDKSGLEILPRSRTFIPAALADNPDLADTGYASTLAGLPEHLRLALAEGKWRAQFEDDAMQVIPTEWVIEAMQRWEKRKAAFDAGEEEMGPMEALGVDPAGGGKARLVMVPRHGTFFDTPAIKSGPNFKDPRETAAAIFFVVRNDAQVNIDNTGGWGAGAVAILESNRHPVLSCIFSAESTEISRHGDAYYNKRAEYYWGMREALDPVDGDDLALYPSKSLLTELCAVTWTRVRHKGRNTIKLEPKEHVEARIGRSPDEGDATVLARAEAGTFDGPLAGDAFHKRSSRSETNRAHQVGKERSRAWRDPKRR